jgi:hypothetical protein
MFDKMKEIKLTKGFVALVDDEDYEYLNQWKWCVSSNGNRKYAIRGIKRSDGRTEIISMHRLIMNTPVGLLVDHIDHNGLNCQRHNMRNCTRSQNNQNRSSRKISTSKYLGVSFNSERKLFRADINDVCIGHFENEIDAAIAYDKRAKELYGEFANINIKYGHLRGTALCNLA